MQWQLMGPSGRIHRPKTETMLAYTQCVTRDTQQVGGGAVGMDVPAAGVIPLKAWPTTIQLLLGTGELVSPAAPPRS